MTDYIISEDDLNDAEVFGLSPDSPICKKARSHLLSEALKAEREKQIEFLNKIRNMVDDTRDLSDQYREEGISSCVQSELMDIIKLIEDKNKSLRSEQP